MECSAVLDVMQVLKLGNPKQIAQGQAVLVRIVSMLTEMSA